MANSRTAYQREWYLKNREKKLAQSREVYAKNRELRLNQTKEYHQAHPEVAQKAYAKYRQNNVGICRARNRSWYRRHEQQERERAKGKTKAYYSENKSSVLAKNKEWRQRNPHRILVNGAKRRALKKGASVNLKQIREWVKSIKSRSFIRCYYCDFPTHTSEIHFDHIIPLSKGGPHSVENLCVSCPKCNLTKKAKTIEAWVRVGQQILAL